MFQTKVNFSEWQTPEQRKAHAALWRRLDKERRFHCNALGFWKTCPKPLCRRNRTCLGDMHACFKRGWALVPEDEKEWIRGVLLAKRAGVHGDEAIRAGDARREAYLASQELKAETGAASAAIAADRMPAPSANARIRRL